MIWDQWNWDVQLKSFWDLPAAGRESDRVLCFSFFLFCNFSRDIEVFKICRATKKYNRETAKLKSKKCNPQTIHLRALSEVQKCFLP